MNTICYIKNMSIITIQSRLVASESTRRQFWELMAHKNTPLINELLRQIPLQPDFDDWSKKGKLPTGTIKNLCDSLKSDPKFNNQPSRFYMSAISEVDYIYKSYFTLRQRLEYQLEGSQRWLEMLKSDEELVEQTGKSLEDIRKRATEILDSVISSPNISKTLFDAYAKSQDSFDCSCISYLLKNGRRIPSKPEDPKKFAKSYRKAEIKIERLKEQIDSRLPKGRDLTGETWFETLNIATTTIPEDVKEVRLWQDKLLTQKKSVPFPVNYETNEDLVWGKNEKGRLCVSFNGLGKHKFELYCDQRQLKYFQRFYEDQQVKKSSKNQYSSALFTLRSGKIVWVEGKGKGELWNINHLYLHCSLDTRFLTLEGTEQVREEKAIEAAKIIASMKEKVDLKETQKACIKRKESTLIRLDNPFPRPSKPLHKGQTNIVVGVSMTLEKPATVAIVNVTGNKIISYCSLKQLLGDNHRLVNRQQEQKKYQAHQRNIAQRNHSHFQLLGNSELGEYIDRLIAKSIVELAKTYQAGSIVVPSLGKIRESIQSELQAKAEAKIPGSKEAQKQYAKQYKMNIHQWSYGRLINNIHSQSAKIGIAIETASQPTIGTPQEKAKDLAITAYHSRSLK